jgi:hypothetical protein
MDVIKVTTMKMTDKGSHSVDTYGKSFTVEDKMLVVKKDDGYAYINISNFDIVNITNLVVNHG